MGSLTVKMTAQKIKNLIEQKCLSEIRVCLKSINQELIKAGLVVVTPYSDDNCVLSGRISDSFDCYNGGAARVCKDGLLVGVGDSGDIQNPPDTVDEVIALAEDLKNSVTLKAVYSSKPDEPTWTYSTSIPFEPFTIVDEDDESRLEAIGIIFSVNDIGSSPEPSSIVQAIRTERHVYREKFNQLPEFLILGYLAYSKIEKELGIGYHYALAQELSNDTHLVSFDGFKILIDNQSPWSICWAKSPSESVHESGVIKK